MNNTHRFGSVRETKFRERLTVLAETELRSGGISGREKEHATVDSHHESQERDYFESVDLSLVEGVLLQSDEGRSNKKDQQNESLEHCAVRSERDRNESNDHFPHIHYCLPVVGMRSVPIVEEAILLFDCLSVKLVSFPSEETGREDWKTYRPESNSQQTDTHRETKMLVFIALFTQLLLKVVNPINLEAAENKRGS